MNPLPSPSTPTVMSSGCSRPGTELSQLWKLRLYWPSSALEADHYMELRGGADRGRGTSAWGVPTLRRGGLQAPPDLTLKL